MNLVCVIHEVTLGSCQSHGVEGDETTGKGTHHMSGQRPLTSRRDDV